jgi:hypothetical protein
LGSSQIFGEFFTFSPSQTTTHPFLQNIRVTIAILGYIEFRSHFFLRVSLEFTHFFDVFAYFHESYVFNYTNIAISFRMPTEFTKKTF